MLSVRTDGPHTSTATGTNINNERATKVILNVIPESKFLSIFVNININSYNSLTISKATSLVVTPGEVRTCKVK